MSNIINPPKSSGREPEETKLLPAGEYLLALVWFKYENSKAGNRYLRCRFVACSGPMKGEGFFCAWSLNTSKVGCLRRWELWMESVGCDHEVDLDNAQALSEAFKGKAFKAQVRRTQNGDYENNDIDRMVYLRQWTPEDIEEAKAWNADWDVKNGWQGKDPSPGGDPQAGEEQPLPADPQWSEGSNFGPGSDDIPF